MNPTVADPFTIAARDTYEDSVDLAPIGPFRITTDLPLMRESSPPTLVFGATQKIGSRIGTVHFAGTAYAVAVDGEDDQYDFFIELDGTETDRAPGAYGWSVRAVFASEAAQTVLTGELTLLAAFGPPPEEE